jgi:hypothetical protein
MFKIIGQRWLLNAPGDRVVVEINSEGVAKVIQIIDFLSPYIIGDIMNLDTSKSYWQYMIGQDKPKEQI